MSAKNVCDLIGDFADAEAGVVGDGDDSLVRLLDQIANDLVVEVFNVLPSYSFTQVFLLLLLQHQFYFLYSGQQLIHFFWFFN